jgi:hypothetical protein
MPQFLAVFTGGPESHAMARWVQLTDEERTARQIEGMQQWNAWVEANADAIVMLGGPLGTVIRLSDTGTAATRNTMSAFTVVSAENHEAAAAMFENHPHFSVFPGDGVDVMPVMPVPGRG